MRKVILATLLLFSCGAVHAGSVATLTLTPSGTLFGAPGGPAVGWDFALTWVSTDNYWLSVTGSGLQFETNTGLGHYTDFVGAQGGPTDFAVAPNTTWIEAFSSALGTGVGQYSVFAGQPWGATTLATLSVSYDVFDGDPYLGGTQVASGSVGANVDIEATTPEPSMLGCSALALGLLAVWQVRARKRSANRV